MLCRFNQDIGQLHPVLKPPAWNHRPNYALEARLRALGKMDMWSGVVDYGAAFQRGLREKEVLIVFSKEQISKWLLGTSMLKEAARGAVATNEQYIRVWINGTTEDVYLSYLLARVPCFTIHEFLMPNYTTMAISPHPPTYLDFLEGTDVGSACQQQPLGWLNSE
jgi:hypothetical protein